MLHGDAQGSSSEWLWLPAPGSATGVHLHGGTVSARACTAAVLAPDSLNTACCNAVAVAARRGCGRDCCPAEEPCAPASGKAGPAGSSQLQSAASANSEETHVSSQHMTATHRRADACAASAVVGSDVHALLAEHDSSQGCQPRGQAEAEVVGAGASGSLPVGHGPPCMKGAPQYLESGQVADQQQSTRSSDGWHLHAEPQVCIDVSRVDIPVRAASTCLCAVCVRGVGLTDLMSTHDAALVLQMRNPVRCASHTSSFQAEWHSVVWLQDMRDASEFDTGGRYIWTPDAARDSLDSPLRGDFVRWAYDWQRRHSNNVVRDKFGRTGTNAVYWAITAFARHSTLTRAAAVHSDFTVTTHGSPREPDTQQRQERCALGARQCNGLIVSVQASAAADAGGNAIRGARLRAVQDDVVGAGGHGPRGA